MLLLMAVAALVSIFQLTVLGSWGRSVRWTTVLQGVLVGYLVCGPVAIALQWAWTRAVAGLIPARVAQVQTFAGWTLDPLIEEVVKVTPLLLLAWLRPREHRQLGWTDHLLIGAGLGMGFELLEAGETGGGGGGEPPRFTDNTSRTRTYGSSVSDIQGQANTWAARMRRRGFTTDVPPMRYGKYGWADVTVKAIKGGRVYIRHFIYKGGG